MSRNYKERMINRYENGYESDDIEGRLLEEEMNGTIEVEKPKFNRYFKNIGLFDDCIEDEAKGDEKSDVTHAGIFDECETKEQEEELTENVVPEEQDEWEEPDIEPDTKEDPEEDNFELEEDENEEVEEYDETSGDYVSGLLDELAEEEMEEEVVNELIAESEAKYEAQYLNDVTTQKKTEAKAKERTTKLTISFEEDLVKKIKILAILRSSTIKDLIESSIVDLLKDAQDEFAALMG